MGRNFRVIFSETSVKLRRIKLYVCGFLALLKNTISGKPSKDNMNCNKISGHVCLMVSFTSFNPTVYVINAGIDSKISDNKKL